MIDKITLLNNRTVKLFDVKTSSKYSFVFSFFQYEILIYLVYVLNISNSKIVFVVSMRVFDYIKFVLD